MKQRFDKSAGGLVFVGLPLLLVAGCATDKANLAQIDPQTPHMAEQAKTPPDQASVPAVESTASPAEQTTPRLPPDEAAAESAAHARQDTETTTSPETQAAASPKPATPAPPETEAVVAANGEPSPIEKATVPLPQQMIIYFGFNQDEITAVDRAIVKQHAEYLLAHPEFTLLITGHADNRGPKAYNERLSEARARKVEQLLEADGVPKQQLRITAMGATSPMVDPANYQQNRRVEFIYQDAVVAKGQ